MNGQTFQIAQSSHLDFRWAPARGVISKLDNDILPVVKGGSEPLGRERFHNQFPHVFTTARPTARGSLVI